MQTVYLVITDCGDGSNNIEWHKTMSDEKMEQLEENNHEKYSSGDGFQVRELIFPDNFDLKAFMELNVLYWWEDDQDE